MDQLERVANVIEAYDGQGVHRTATDVDERSAQWLANEVRAIGLEPVLESYEIERVDPENCYLEIDGRRIEGVPLFDSAHTEPDGVSGQLGVIGDDTEIALMEVAHGSTDWVELRRMATHQALIIITRGHSPGLSLLNAFDFNAPVGPPALQISSTESEWLHEQAKTGAKVNVVAHVSRSHATAYNVTAELIGRDITMPPLVVNTPRSGWWEIAAERGGGLACWLEVLRSLVSTDTQRPVFFSANTGHELGYSGIEAVLDAHQNLATDATWVHFGANIGAASGTVGRLHVSTERLRTLAEEKLEGVSRPVSYVGDGSLAPRTAAGGGEMTIVHRRGGRKYMALTNNNAYFHMREDRYPQNVNIDAVAEFANAFSSIAQSLANPQGEVIDGITD